MRKITSQDIQEMLQEKIQESLNVLAGKGKKKKVIISPDFKIIHNDSRLTYTVDSVKIIKGKPVILAHSGDQKFLAIGPEEFKNYKGL